MMRRTGWRTAKNLSDNMDWKYPSEPKVLTWAVSAIDRSVLYYASIFALPVGIPFLGVCALLLNGEWGWAGGVFGVFLYGLFLFYKVGMERTVFVYRASSKRLEICQWQDIPDSVFTFIRAFPFIALGIIAMAFISNPALSIAALAGPALVGLLVASVGGDSNYKAIYKRFRHREFKWEDVDRAILDIDKGLLALSISHPDNLIHDHEIDFDDPAHHRYLTRIYFDKKCEKEVLDLFRKKISAQATIVERSYTFAFSGIS